MLLSGVGEWVVVMWYHSGTDRAARPGTTCFRSESEQLLDGWNPECFVRGGKPVLGKLVLHRQT